jgi:predicted site-specific integrase-resolvase
MNFDNEGSPFLTQGETLKKLRISGSTLWRYRKKGFIKDYWMGGLRFKEEDVINLYYVIRRDERHGE